MRPTLTSNHVAEADPDLMIGLHQLQVVAGLYIYVLQPASLYLVIWTLELGRECFWGASV